MGVTRIPHRFLFPLLAPIAVAVALGATGCGLTGGGDPDTTPGPTADASPSGSVDPSASSSASASPSASPTQLVNFTVDGAGPYQLGRTLTQLTATPGLSQVSANADCPGNQVARGTGVWGQVDLHFRPNGQLYLLVNRDQEIPTPSGAFLGTNLSGANQFSPKGLKEIYTGAGLVTEELSRGSAKAFLVQPPGGRALLFELNANSEVNAMYAGEGSFLRASFIGSGKFC